MKLSRKIIYFLICLSLIAATGFQVHAGTQTLQVDSRDSTDFSGKIKKFNPDFEGVGPKVYFLPPPASEEELMSQQYLDQEPETITIPKILSRTVVMDRLKPTGGTGLEISRFAGPRQSAEGWLLMEIDFASRIGNTDRVADMQNLLGVEYFRLGTVEQALELLERARSRKAANNDQHAIMAINYNLAILHEYTENLQQARTLLEAALGYARRQRNRWQQADILTRLAVIKAKQGAYYEAEQDIIIKAVPLFRRLRNTQGDKGRIAAYNALSDIYRLQHRYPEAQWFLLQAREVAINKKLPEYIPAITFNLAEVKNSSGNKEVAIAEYKMADEMARGQQDFLVMRLAIQDALGDIYHDEGKFREALEALDRFDSIKKQLISADFPF